MVLQRKVALMKKMYKLLNDEFSKDVYHQKVSHNIERWKEDVAWAKERAKQLHGYVKSPDDAGWGIWELTEKGKKLADELIRKLESANKVILRKKKT